MPPKSCRETALEHRAKNNGYRPATLRDSPQRRAKKAKARFDPELEQGLLYRLSRVLKRPSLFVCHAAHLELPKSKGKAECIYDPATLELWRFAAKTKFNSPLFGQFEIDRFGLLHCHVIAETGAIHGLEGLPLTDWQGWAAYLGKPHDARADKKESWLVKLEAEGAFLEAQRRAKAKSQRLPKRSFSVGIPKAH